MLDRRDDDAVAADEGVRADARGVPPTVVVGEDRAGPDVAALPDGDVTSVREVGDLGPGGDPRVLGLDEAADLAAGAELGAGAEVAEGPDVGAGADDREQGLGADDGGAVTDLDVLEGGVGSDDAVGADRAGSVDLGVRVDDGVGSDGDGGVDPRRRRVDDRGAARA